MNQTIKNVGLLAILPLAMVALTPDLIGEAYAASFDPDQFAETKDNGSAFEERLASLEN